MLPMIISGGDKYRLLQIRLCTRSVTELVLQLVSLQKKMLVDIDVRPFVTELTIMQFSRNS